MHGFLTQKNALVGALTGAADGLSRSFIGSFSTVILSNPAARAAPTV